MKRVEENSSLKRRQRFLLVLPLLVIPFVTMTFWALGGGKGSGDAKDLTNSEGLKMSLPDANLKEEKDQSKMAFYERADKDLADEKRKSEMDEMSFGSQRLKTDSIDKNLSFNPSSYDGSSYKDPNEEKVYQKLAEINSQISQASQPAPKESKGQVSRSKLIATEDVDRLEAMLGTEGQGARDPEMERIDSVMEKILDIQHPERVKARAPEKESEEKIKANSVRPQKSTLNISLLDTIPFDSDKQGNDFYSSTTTADSLGGNSIRAVVNDGRSFVNGAVIKLRLMDEASIGSSVIPKGSFVFGIVSLEAERLMVKITSVRLRNSILPVNLTVYDLDGIEGIFIPDAINRDVAKTSIENASQSLDITSFDPSLKMQAASAGIGAAKSLLSKKVKLTKAFIKPGYEVLLIDKTN